MAAVSESPFKSTCSTCTEILDNTGNILNLAKNQQRKSLRSPKLICAPKQVPKRAIYTSSKHLYNSWFSLYSQISSPLVREERLALCHPSGAAGIIISVHGFGKHFRSPQNLSFFSENTSEEDLCSAHTSWEQGWSRSFSRHQRPEAKGDPSTVSQGYLVYRPLSASPARSGTHSHTLWQWVQEQLCSNTQQQ